MSSLDEKAAMIELCVGAAVSVADKNDGLEEAAMDVVTSQAVRDALLAKGVPEKVAVFVDSLASIGGMLVAYHGIAQIDEKLKQESPEDILEKFKRDLLEGPGDD